MPYKVVQLLEQLIYGMLSFKDIPVPLLRYHYVAPGWRTVLYCVISLVPAEMQMLQHGN